jgi:hypothetical protein
MPLTARRVERVYNVVDKFNSSRVMKVPILLRQAGKPR